MEMARLKPLSRADLGNKKSAIGCDFAQHDLITIYPRTEISASWVISAGCMLLITFLSIAGNAVVMRAVRKAQRAPAHYPLASLAAADLLVGVSVLPIAAARDLFWFQLPWVLCACWSTLDVLCCTASILSICALGWERWCGITAPLARAKRMRRAKISALLIWPVSTAIALPTAFIPSAKHFHPNEMAKACTVNTNVGYVFSSISCSFYLPASLMMFLYARILSALAAPPAIRAHRGRNLAGEGGKIINNNCNRPTAITKSNISIPQEPLPEAILKFELGMTPKRGHLSVPEPASCNVPSPLKTSNSPGGIIPRQRRATRTIVMLMSLFLICWTPFFVMLPVDSLCECVQDAIWQWCTWLGYANSALNPMVYAAGSPSVRRALRSSFSTYTSSSARCTEVPLTPNLRKP